jgi:hypothetical protein
VPSFGHQGRHSAEVETEVVKIPKMGSFNGPEIFSTLASGPSFGARAPGRSAAASFVPGPRAQKTLCTTGSKAIPTRPIA